MKIQNKVHSKSGLARIHVILMVICAVLLIAVLTPAYKAYQYHGQWLACAASLRVVNGAFIVDLLDKGEAVSINDAADDLVAILPGREGYCPSGGSIYFQKEENGVWKAVCGMHDSDHAKRTRLNASYVLKQVQEQVHAAQRKGNKYPEEVTVILNSTEIVCKLVTEETGIRRGTGTTHGYEGTVVFYGIAGHGTFKSNGTAGSEGGTKGNSGLLQVNAEGAPDGEICYFCFADEDYNADWRVEEGWSGKSYGDLY